MKVPTAEKFLDKKAGTRSKWITEIMIEFSKLHVKAAIEMCIEEASLGLSTDNVSYEDVAEALKDCYPESLVR
jgi:hypothetical protein